jgi:sugar/nucleoside kinase (ribokinase family)
MQGQVFVVGDANLDLIVRGDVVPAFGQVEQLVDDAELVLGGSAAIVASGCARLGLPTSLVATVGDDQFGRITLELLTANGVDVSRVRVVPGVGTGLSIHLATPGDRAILTRPGSIPLLSAADVEAALPADGVAWVHFASPFLIPDLTAELSPILDSLRERGTGTSLDTNWDPEARWSSVLPLLGRIDVLLPNRAELVALAAATGYTGSDPAQALAALGPRVVVKDGAKGGFSVDGTGLRASALGLTIDVIDTTGAGDSFDAGYIAALARDVELEEERLLWATRAGSLSTRGLGGTSAQATAAELLSP